MVAGPDVFPDPCPGTYKYLEVQYECVPFSEYLLFKYLNIFPISLIAQPIVYHFQYALCEKHAVCQTFIKTTV